MSQEPILDFRKTKDLDAVIVFFRDGVTRNPMVVSSGLARQLAAFFYVAVKEGIIAVGDLKARIASHVEGFKDAMETKNYSDENRAEVVSEVAFEPATQLMTTAAMSARIWLGVESEDQLVAEVLNGTQMLDMKMAMEKAGIPMNQGILDQVGTELRERLHPNPEEVLTLVTLDKAEYNDFCYMLYFASGDRRYIERVIKALEQDVPQPAPGHPADLVVTDQSMVPITAAWSLSSLMEQDPIFTEIVASTPGAVERIRVIIATFNPGG